MQVKLGPLTVDLRRIQRIMKIKQNVAKITFMTGNSILVTCGVKAPNSTLISYPGTYDELKALIERNKA